MWEPWRFVADFIREVAADGKKTQRLIIYELRPDRTQQGEVR